MLVIPAIDIKNGKCVRLREGKMDEETIFSSNPIDVASSWFNQGAELLHIVDLDGAIKGDPVNQELIMEIIRTFKDLPIQIGGGIRSIETAKQYLDSGAKRLVLGTSAVKEPNLIQYLCNEFPNRIVLGIDSKEGRVKIDGWIGDSNIAPHELVKSYEGIAISGIIYTDISRDGMMIGVNIEETLKLASNTEIPIIASGGVSDLDQIREIALKSRGKIFGVICGRSLYEGAFTLKEAITASKLK